MTHKILDHDTQKFIYRSAARPKKSSTPTIGFNRNMSKSKGWTLQSSLLTLWMEKTRANNETKIDDDENLLISL